LLNYINLIIYHLINTNNDIRQYIKYLLEENVILTKSNKTKQEQVWALIKTFDNWKLTTVLPATHNWQMAIDNWQITTDKWPLISDNKQLKLTILNFFYFQIFSILLVALMFATEAKAESDPEPAAPGTTILHFYSTI
jgi:hypothetical protein